MTYNANATPAVEYPAERAESLADAHAQHLHRLDTPIVEACVWALRHGDSPEALVEAIRRHVERNP